MKKTVFWSLVLAAVLALGFSPIAAAESAYEDLEGVYEDTAYFDGGDGSTINTSPAAEDEGYYYEEE